MPPGRSGCSARGPGWAGLRAQDRGQERAPGRGEDRSAWSAGSRAEASTGGNSPAEGGWGLQLSRGQQRVAGRGAAPAHLLALLGLCSPQALPALDGQLGQLAAAARTRQDHPAPSPLQLWPPLPQAGSGHEILSKTFPLQNNPSKYVFGNRLLISRKKLITVPPRGARGRKPGGQEQQRGPGPPLWRHTHAWPGPLSHPPAPLSPQMGRCRPREAQGRGWGHRFRAEQALPLPRCGVHVGGWVGVCIRVTVWLSVCV